MPTTLILKLAACLSLVAALIFGWHELTSHYDRQGYTRAKAEDTAAADQQAARNRELQRQAELHYTVQAATRDHFIVKTVKEIHEAAAPLVSCPIPADVVRLLDAARSCAIGDSPSSCGPDQPVRNP